MKKVAIKGIAGSFHDQIASEVFGANYRATYCLNFTDVISEVTKNKCEYGVIAIENTLAGSIQENYHLLRDRLVEIVGERYLQIDHQLLALPGQKLNNIDIVISHQMAFKQCKNFLDKSAIKSKQSFSDTASATQHIGQNQIKGIASIGSVAAAKKYGLEVISSNIQDNPKNYTRFLIIQRSKPNRIDADKDKATIIFSVHDAPGRLAIALNYLEGKGVNLTKIESVPQLNNPGRYDMITDLELPLGEQFKDILPELYQLVDEIKVLGVYEKTDEPWK